MCAGQGQIFSNLFNKNLVDTVLKNVKKCGNFGVIFGHGMSDYFTFIFAVNSALDS